MNWDRVSGNWKQMKGKIKEQWGKLTDDEIEQIAGNREQLEGKIQERYGIAKDQVRKQVDDATPQLVAGPYQPGFTPLELPEHGAPSEGLGLGSRAPLSIR